MLYSVQYYIYHLLQYTKHGNKQIIPVASSPRNPKNIGGRVLIAFL